MTEAIYHVKKYLEWVNFVREHQIKSLHYHEQIMRFYAQRARDIYLFFTHRSESCQDGNSLVAVMHSDCCRGVAKHCTVITYEMEKEIATIVDEMFSDSEYASIVAQRLLETKATETNCIYQLRKQAKHEKKLFESTGYQLCRDYMKMALWKNYFGRELSLLECFLLNNGTQREIGIETNALTERLNRLIPHCFRNASFCRCCGKKTQKMLQCQKCKNVYFCNKSCQMDAGHDDNECTYLKTNE